jgi:hypothetical protein
MIGVGLTVAMMMVALVGMGVEASRARRELQKLSPSEQAVEVHGCRTAWSVTSPGRAGAGRCRVCGHEESVARHPLVVDGAARVRRVGV